MYASHASRTRGAASPYGGSGARVSEWSGYSMEPSQRLTQVQSFVDRCCDPSLEQPNLSLALELADYINVKKANTAREAAFEIVDRVNSRLPHVGMLALHLLDILVKNCGFPMHLQIATKEFLNELVRRFPERPPMHPGPVMTRILEMIHEWRQTICVTSKYKEDLVHIRDMHRLLMYKGYRFPKVDARSAAVLSTSERLQSPEELEEETRAAQSAKLQELIRRGTPRDLQQAQELMKILSGAEPEKNNVHAKQISRDMDKIESRIKLLNDMLDQAKETDKFVAGDAYDQVASNLRGVQPRLQKWIEQAEEDESEYLQRFLEVNDKILQALDRYDVMATGTSRPRARGTELISFDEAEEAPTPNPPSSAPGKSKAPSSFLDDLESLSLHDTTSARPSAPSSASSQAKPKAAQSSNVFDLLGDMDEPLASPNTPAAAPSRPLTSLTTSSSSTAAPPAAHDPFAGLDFLK